MAMVRCSNDLHYYDSAQYDSCPYCESASSYDVPSFIVKGQNLRASGQINAKTELRIGNIFDVSNDLIVLPCNTYGNVTDFVAKSLKEFGIAYPPPNMSLGYVYIKPFTGNGITTKFIGFAVSVDRMVCTPEAINYIGQQIGQFTTQEPSVRIVSAPLLGVGAGGLTSEVAATQLQEGFLARAHSESTLVVSVLQQDIYERIISTFKTIRIKQSASEIQTLRVFLCHSSGDKPKVRELYRQLSKDGVNPWLDEENLLPGQDWQIEISKAVRNSDVVIVCLSKGSVTKAGYIQKEIKQVLDVADEQPEGTIFVIPLKLEECDVPERLKRWQWVNLFDDNGYQRLIRSLNLRVETKNDV
jgi:hypothetical protein